MEELKSLFGDEALNYDAFEKKLADAGDSIKLVNLANHEYVDRNVYEKQKSKLEKELDEYKTRYNTLAEKTQNHDELQNQFDELNTKYKELLDKQETAEKLKMIAEANVDKRFEEFVYSKVNPQVSEENDFQTVLGDFLKENSQYLTTSKGTFVDLQNGSSAPQSSNETINNWLRGK